MSVYLKFHLVQEIHKDLIRLEELDKATYKDLKETNEFSGFFLFFAFFFSLRGLGISPSLWLKLCHYKLRRTCPSSLLGRGKQGLETVLSKYK